MYMKRRHRNIFSYIIIAVGAGIIIWWVPLWVWIVAFGIILIVTGINIYK